MDRSAEYLNAAKPEAVAQHDEALTERLAGGIPRDRYELVSPASGERRSTLVVIRATDGRDAESVKAALADAGVDTAVREGAVRISPHLYNTNADIDRALSTLAAA